MTKNQTCIQWSYSIAYHKPIAAASILTCSSACGFKADATSTIGTYLILAKHEKKDRKKANEHFHFSTHTHPATNKLK